MGAALPAAGLLDPVFEAQAVFRALLEATARPGRTMPLPAPAGLAAPDGPPPPLPAPLASLALTLADRDTPVFLGGAPPDAAVRFLAFHTGAPVTTVPGEAAIALLADPAEAPPLDAFRPGCDRHPERSATVAIAVERLSAGKGPLLLDGPGIAATSRLHAAPLPKGFLAARAANHALFPRGVDVLLVADGRLAALPRTTRVREAP